MKTGGSSGEFSPHLDRAPIKIMRNYRKLSWKSTTYISVFLPRPGRFLDSVRRELLTSASFEDARLLELVLSIFNVIRQEFTVRFEPQSGDFWLGRLAGTALPEPQ
jgi:hypothetical protein